MGLSIHPAPWDSPSSSSSSSSSSTALAYSQSPTSAIPLSHSTPGSSARPSAAVPGMNMGSGNEAGLRSGEGAAGGGGMDSAGVEEGGAGGGGADRGGDRGGGVPGSAMLQALCASLSLQRNSRELALQLRTALRDASAEWRYTRLQGLKSLARLLHSASHDADVARLFQESQLYSQLQVVPVVYAHSLAPHLEKLPGQQLEGSRMESQKQMLEELVLALHCIQGCCLLHGPSRAMTSRTSICQDMSTLLLKLSQSEALGVPQTSSVVADVAPACLQTLLAMTAENPQLLLQGGVLERCGLLPAVASLVSCPLIPTPLRLQASEFLLLTGFLIASATGDLHKYMTSAPVFDDGYDQPSAANAPVLSDILGSEAIHFLDQFCTVGDQREPWAQTAEGNLVEAAEQLMSLVIS